MYACIIVELWYLLVCHGIHVFECGMMIPHLIYICNAWKVRLSVPHPYRHPTFFHCPRPSLFFQSFFLPHFPSTIHGN